MFINKINISDDYNKFPSIQKIIHAFLGEIGSTSR